MKTEQLEKVKEIRNWIIEKYPDSCIAVNDKNNGPSPDDAIDDKGTNCLLAEVRDFFLYEIMDFCGCGIPFTSMMDVRNYLTIVKINHEKSFDEGHKLTEKIFGVKCACDNSLLQFMAYTLDSYGLTEHGTSINGAWLEDLGKKCLTILDIVFEEEKKTCSVPEECEKCQWRHLCNEES